jgi:integral membrane protein
MNISSALGRLRLLGILEGISLLVLLAVAMPMKYLAGNPHPVKIVGWIHGGLFVLFMIAVLMVAYQRKWKFIKFLLAFLAAFFPFGTFIFDAQLKKEEQNNKER